MPLWRVEEAAEYLGIRPKTLYEWVRTGRVPYRKLGFNVRFDPDELRSWVQQQPAVTPGAPPAATPDVPPGADPVASTPTAPAAAALAELVGAATAGARQLRRVETDLGAHLSFPQRQAMRELAQRLERAALDCADAGA